MPNPYQLFALCHILQIPDMLTYFTGVSADAPVPFNDLNEQGQSLLTLLKDALIASGQFTDNTPVSTEETLLTMKVFDEPAAAGPGNFLTSGSYELIDFPADAIPKRARIGVRVSGISMLPRYVNGQIVWVEPTTRLYNGEIGVFY